MRGGTRKILFASVAKPVKEYKGILYGGVSEDDAMYLRYGDDSFGNAQISANKKRVYYDSIVDDKKVYLVVQNSLGTWATEVSGEGSVSVEDLQDEDETVDRLRLPDFENCKIWLEWTDDEQSITYAEMAEELFGDVTVTAGGGMEHDPNSGNVTQSGFAGAIKDIVYEADKDHYFPSNYADSLDAGGLKVTRNDASHITISGVQEAKKVELKLPDATEKAEQAAPNVEFYARGEDYGSLYDVTTSMVYSVDGGNNWNNIKSDDIITTTWTYIRIDRVTTTNGIQIKILGNESSQESPITKITVTKAAKPDLGKKNCSFRENEDGQITGLDSDKDYEYKLATDSSWKPMYVADDGTGTSINLFPEGTYQVRVCAANPKDQNQVVQPQLASEPDEVTIEHDGHHTTLHYNEKEHWTKCKDCDKVFGRQAHYGGKATLTEKAKCQFCKQEYGDLASATVTVTAGDNMKAGPRSGDSPQTVADNITPIAYWAEDGFYFPEDYLDGIDGLGSISESESEKLKSGEKDGIKVTKLGTSLIVISGKPTATSVKITLPAATEKPEEAKPAEMPQAVFEATGNDGGTLSNVTTAMKYSVDGGNEWIAIEEDGSISIDGVTPEYDIQVYQPGNGTSSLDSPRQTIEVTQAKAPGDLPKEDCATYKQNDGKITGLDGTMAYEYQLADGEWTGVNAGSTEITELKNGIYNVRVKANGTQLASEPAEVTIGAHTCEPGEWQTDETHHWKKCTSETCNAELGKKPHSGPAATCTRKAVCDVCEKEYGNIDSANHTDLREVAKVDATCTATGNIQYWHCDGCKKNYSNADGTGEITDPDKLVTQTKAHEPGIDEWYSDKEGHWRVCKVCGIKLDSTSHEPDENTWYSNEKGHCRVCKVCGTKVDIAEHNLKTGTWYSNEKGHCHPCSVCEAAVKDSAEAHTPDSDGWYTNGEKHWRVCKECNKEYGSGSHIPVESIWYSDDNNHWRVCDECGIKLDSTSHEPDEDTWYSNDEDHWRACKVCGIKLDSTTASHTPDETGWHTDGKSHWYVCSECKKEYGSAAHTPDKTGWHTNDKSHWYECSECKKVYGSADHDFAWVIDRKVTENQTGLRHEECTVCKYAKESVEFRLYQFIDGADGTYTQNVDGEYMVTVDGEFENFEGVFMDGKKVDPKNYEAKSGSTIITFTEAYMNSLSLGKHTLMVGFTDGMAETTLMVKEKAAEVTTTDPASTTTNKDSNGDSGAKTGDETNLALWFALVLLSGAVITVFAVKRNKKRKTRD